MEVSVLYHSRRLKPPKHVDGSSASSARPPVAPKDKKNKLKLWKKVEALRYRCAEELEMATGVDRLDERGFETRELTMVAFCRNSSQGRLYSLHNNVGDDGQKKRKKKVKRKKTKLLHVSFMTLSPNGRFAAVAIGTELVIKVFDLGSRSHPVVMQFPFPECLAVPDLKKRKELVLPPPQFLHVSDDGEAVLSQSKNRGTVWLYGAHQLGVAKQWKVLLGEGGLSMSINAHFLSSTAPISVDVWRVYPNEEDVSKLGLAFHRVHWDPDVVAYRIVSAQTRSMDMLIPENRLNPICIESIIQRYNVNMYNSFAAIAVNLQLTKTVNVDDLNEDEVDFSEIAPKVIFHEPFSQFAVMTSLGEIVKSFTKERHRICDMAWTRDNLFLAVTISDGSLILLSSSGDPVKLHPANHIDGPMKRKPRYQLFFRDLEKYEEKGKVPTTFGIASHPHRAELTWCDGNANLVHIYLPTQNLLITGGHQEETSVVPVLSYIQTLIAKVSLQGLSVSEHVSPLQRALQAWTLCMNPTIGWTHAEREITRLCADQLVDCIIDELVDSEMAIIQTFTYIISIATWDFRSAQELAYLTRSLVLILIEEAHFYAAVHILRMTEAHFHYEVEYAKHRSLAYDIAFDRHWLYLGAFAMLEDFRDEDNEEDDDRSHDFEDKEDKEMAAAILGYGQQRARAWAFLRSNLNKERSSLVSMKHVRNASKDPLAYTFPSVASTVWPGHEKFLRGAYDEAEAAYFGDESGSYPGMCLLLRRIRLRQAIQIAKSWWNEPNRKRYRAAFGILGSVIASMCMDRRELRAVPSPCSHPSARSIRILDLAMLEKRCKSIPEWKPWFAALLLLENDQIDLAFELLYTVADHESVIKALKSKTACAKFSVHQRTKIYTRHLMVLLALGEMQLVKRLVISVLQLVEHPPEIIQELIWILLIQLNNSAQGELSVEVSYVSECGLKPSSKAVNPLVLLGRLVLKLLWGSNYSEPQWKPILFHDKKGFQYKWFDIMRAAVLVFCRISPTFKGMLMSPEQYSTFLRSRGELARERKTAFQVLCQFKDHETITEILEIIFREVDVYDESSDEEEQQEQEEQDLEEIESLPSEGDVIGEEALLFTSPQASAVQVTPLDLQDDADFLKKNLNSPFFIQPKEHAERPAQGVQRAPKTETDSWAWSSEEDDEHEEPDEDESPSRILSPRKSPSLPSSPVSGQEFESPWVFTQQKQNRLEQSIMEALKQQKQQFEKVLSTWESDAAKPFQQAISNLDKKIELLADQIAAQQHRDDKSALVSSSEDSEKEDAEGMPLEDHHSDHHLDVSDYDDDEFGPQTVSAATRTFLSFANRHKGPKRPAKNPPTSYDEETSDEEDMIGNPEKMNFGKYNNEYRALFGQPPMITGVPPLLGVHPTTQQSSRVHQYRKKYIQSKNSGTQTVAQEKDGPVLETGIQTENVQPFLLDRMEMATSPFQVTTSPRSHFSQPQQQTAAAATTHLHERGFYEVNNGPDIMHVPKEVNMHDFAYNRRLTIKKKTLEEQEAHNVPIIMPMAYPKIYLNLRADGQKRRGKITKNQHKMPNYLHVADLDENSPGIARMVPSKMQREPPRQLNRFRAVYEGSI